MAVDIDGDGVIDENEVRLAEMIEKRQKDGYSGVGGQLNLLTMKRIGREMLCQEFISRNSSRLWKFGKEFEDTDLASLLAWMTNHPNLSNLMKNLKNIEQHLNISDSSKVEASLKPGSHSAPLLQTWVQTTRGVPLSACEAKSPEKQSRFSRPCTSVGERASHTSEVDDSSHVGQSGIDVTEERSRQLLKTLLENGAPVHFNGAYSGAVDIDGDGVIDEMELKLAPQLKFTSGIDVNVDGVVDDSELMATRQLAGRKQIASDFVREHYQYMGNYQPELRGKKMEDMVDILAANPQFAKVMNQLRAKGRLTKLSAGDGAREALNSSGDENDNKKHLFTTRLNTARPVRSRTELFAIRDEIRRHGDNLDVQKKYSVKVQGQTCERHSPQHSPIHTSANNRHTLQSEVGKPKMYAFPRRMEPTPARVSSTARVSLWEPQRGDL